VLEINLNSFKCVAAGHIVLRGWSESPNSSVGSPNSPLDQKKLWSLQKCREKPNANHSKKTSMKDNKVILWFEVEDTGCGMNLSTKTTQNRPFGATIKSI